MAHKIKAARGGKLLPFEQDGDFYYRSGMAKMDKNDLVGAIASYRTALDKDPGNPDIVLGIAEILTAMERYDESNRLLMVHFRDEVKKPAEVYFGMGCNFMAQREYDQARVSFDKYLDMEPEGEYAYSAYDMAEAIDDGTAPGQEEDNFKQAEAAQAARRMMEQENFQGAAEELEKILGEAPDLIGARNNLSLAYYFLHKYDKATEQMGIVLKDDPKNIQAHCNLALFMRGARDDVGLKRAVEYLKEADPQDQEDIKCVGVTLMEMQEFKAALPIVKKLALKLPYDAVAVHHLGVCAYYNKIYDLACGCYDKLLKIDRWDSVARYYRNLCRAAKNGAVRQSGLMMNYQVPADEVILRIRKLNEYLKMPREELKAQWHSGSDLHILVKWGLTIPDISVKRAMLSFAASFSDADAEDILRDFALRRENSPEIKRDAFGLLKSMGASEPYLSYIDGELMESRVSLVPVLPKGMPKAYGDVIESAVQFMWGIRSDSCINKAIELWSQYVKNIKDYPPLSKGQALALAAVLEYLACRDDGEDATKWELCSKYGISITRFNNAFAKLGKVLHIGSVEHTEE